MKRSVCLIALMGLFLTGMLVLGGCAKNVQLYKQALREYNAGNFENSLDTSVRSLRLKPQYVKAQSLADQAYRDAIRNREDNIKTLEASSAADRFDKMVEEYAALNEIQSKVKNLPVLIDNKTGRRVEFIIRDYSVASKAALNNAAEYHYQQGLSLSRSSADVDVQKHAAKEFKLAMGFIQNYKDSPAQYEKARKAGIKRIAVIPFEDRSGTNRIYGDLPAMLVDNIVSSIINDAEASEFVEIITRDQMGSVLQEQRMSASGMLDETTAAHIGEVLGVHEIMTGKISQVVYIAPKIYSTSETEKKRVVTGQEEYQDEDGNTKTKDVYGDVECSFTKYVKSTNAQITCSYSIIDVNTGKIKKQGTYTGENPWSDTWGRKESGDERALSTATINLCKKAEPTAPAAIELVNVALTKLSKMVSQEFKAYVR